VAFSQEIAEGFSFRPAAAFARELFRILIQEREMLPKDLLLNVNIPAGPVQGVSLTRLGRRVYKQSVIEKLDPRGRKYYWIHGTPQWEKASGTDFEAMSSGRISVTPLHLDLTYYPGLESLGDLRDRLAGIDLSDHRTP
jgi:5'-nucleotidase